MERYTTLVIWSTARTFERSILLLNAKGFSACASQQVKMSMHTLKYVWRRYRSSNAFHWHLLYLYHKNWSNENPGKFVFLRLLSYLSSVPPKTFYLGPTFKLC